MVSGSLARRYARALIQLGEESKSIDKFEQELSAFVEVLSLADGALKQALENPGLTILERRGVLNEVLAKSGLSEVTQNFLRLLVDKNRFNALETIVREYRSMSDERNGRVRAKVTTAKKITKTMTAKVEKALKTATGKEVIVSYSVDPSLIGGMIAKVGDTVYDASVLSRLEELQQALVRGPADA